ncbi:hypothetical protein ACH4ZX_38825 [Streptomyces sp. NPDC020490]|uniref:hypothetical protein n=1 Tax=Streptomyces sp. NPDC020490 TaxID=3365078 RepID=UPI0037AF9380
MTDLYTDGPAEANKTRAFWALAALEAFGLKTGQNYSDGTLDMGEDALGEIAGDLLANVFHLARFNSVDPDSIVRSGYLHFEAEVEEEREEEAEKVDG